MGDAVRKLEPEGRVPPQALEIEEAVLGSMMLESGAMDKSMEHLKPDHFYKTLHRHTFKAMIDLTQEGKPVDMISVEQKLRDQDIEFPDYYLPDLTRSVSSTANIEYHCQIIIEKAIKRNLILNCNELIREGYDSSSDAYDLVDDAQERMFSLVRQSEGRMHDISDVMQSVLHRIMDIQENGEPIGYMTGLDIDATLNGFQDGKLYVIGARPSMGKTALVITMQKKLAANGIMNGLISLETTAESIGVRFLAQESNIPAERIVKPGLTETEKNALMDAGARLSEKGIIIDDSTNLSDQQIRSKCRLMKKMGCKVLFIDFLTLIRKIGRSKHEEVGDIMKALKSISKELSLPVVILAQLSREVEKRSDKRPMMSDLRESGSIEEDADVIMFLYRAEYYGIEVDKDNNSTEGIMEVIIAKNKDGKVGKKDLYFDKETMTVKNLSSFSNEPRRFKNGR